MQVLAHLPPFAREYKVSSRILTSEPRAPSSHPARHRRSSCRSSSSPNIEYIYILFSISLDPLKSVSFHSILSSLKPPPLPPLSPPPPAFSATVWGIRGAITRRRRCRSRSILLGFCPCSAGPFFHSASTHRVVGGSGFGFRQQSPLQLHRRSPLLPFALQRASPGRQLGAESAAALPGQVGLIIPRPLNWTNHRRVT